MFEFQFYALALILVASLGLFLIRAGVRVQGFLLGMVAWMAYISMLGHSGVLHDFSPPPRILLLVVIPAFGIISWVFLTGRHRLLLESVPPWLPMVFQSFRIWVEFLLLGAYLRGLASAEPTMAGYNYDILVPLSGLSLAFLVYKKRVFGEKWVFAWNVAGLCILASVVFTFMTLAAFPSLWGYETTTVKPMLGEMPYLLVAGFFMPVAVFMHVFSIIQIRQTSRVAHSG
ncbi:MAG: hypothetical protein EPGJADBJ_00337 [Saprospiraceae bacterium]|nr:hypothetical protein [Saprospiraceae bacterium]